MKTQFGDCVLLEELNVLMCGSRRVHIEPKTKHLCQLLMTKAPHVVPREELLDNVWQGVYVSADAFYRGICKLRKSLDAVGTTQVHLQTIPKSGYRLVTAG
jgi:DNA-binding winged helix-turn-helix (wHTH) protein